MSWDEKSHNDQVILMYVALKEEVLSLYDYLDEVEMNNDKYYDLLEAYIMEFI